MMLAHDERHISTIQVPSFPVAVERVADLRLRTKPVIIAPVHSPRSLVIAVSGEARSDGVFEGMPLREAVRLCPSAALMPPNGRLYRRASRALSEIFNNFTPLVEPFLWGSSHLDLSGTHRLLGPTLDAAAWIQREIRERLRLDTAVGVASNKLTSRIASSVTEPLTIREVFAGGEGAFISPYDAMMLPAVDRLVMGALREVNLLRIGQIAAVTARHLVLLLGQGGFVVHRQSRGVDTSPVQVPELKPLLREETTLEEDTNERSKLLRELERLTLRIGRTLRCKEMATRELRLTVAYSDEREEHGMSRLRHPLSLDEDLYAAARELFTRVLKRRIRVRTVEITAARLSRTAGQVELFPPSGKTRKKAALNSALDVIRGKYGEGAAAWAERV